MGEGRGFFFSVLVGLCMSVVVGTVLTFAAIPLSVLVGTFVGGLASGLIHHARLTRTTLAGFLTGLFSFPLELVLFVALIYAGLLSIPQPTETIPEDVTEALVAIVLAQIAAGTIGGSIGGALRPRLAEVEAPGHMDLTLQEPRKTCVQCGAPIESESRSCSACGAKQPPA